MQILGTLVHARLTSLGNLNFEDFLNNVVQNQYGFDFSQYVAPSLFQKPNDNADPQHSEDNILQNVIGHISG